MKKIKCPKCAKTIIPTYLGLIMPYQIGWRLLCCKVLVESKTLIGAKRKFNKIMRTKGKGK